MLDMNFILYGAVVEFSNYLIRRSQIKTQTNDNLYKGN